MYRLDDNALILHDIDRLIGGNPLLVEQIDRHGSVEHIQRRDIIPVLILLHLHTEAGAADRHRRLGCAHLVHRARRQRLCDLIQDRAVFQDDGRLIVRRIARSCQLQTGVRLHQDKFRVIQYQAQRSVRIGLRSVAVLQIHARIRLQIAKRFARDDRFADHFKHLDDTVFIRPVFQDETGHHCRCRHDQSRDPEKQLAVQ